MPKHSAALNSATVRSPSSVVLPYSTVHPDGPGRSRPAIARCGSSLQECQRVHDGSRASTCRLLASTRAGSSGHGCCVPDPDLLRAGHSRRAMSWHQRRPAATFAKGYADKMIEPALHAVVADHVFDGAAVHECGMIMHGASRRSCRAGRCRGRSPCGSCLRVHGSPLDLSICR